MKAAMLALALIAGGATAQTPWPAIALTEEPSRAEIEVLARDFPHSGALQRLRASEANEAGDSATVRDALMRLAEMGGTLSAAGRDSVRAHFDDAQWAELNARMDANEAPMGDSRVAYTISADHLLIEGLASNCSGMAFATSVVGRQLLRYSDSDGWTVVALPADTGSLFGLYWDIVRMRLWIASGATDTDPSPETAFSGLIAYNPVTGAIERFPAPVGAKLGDIAVVADGAVYASDGASGAIYRLLPGGALTVWIAPGALRSAQGIANPANGHLYVADYGYGIARINPRTGEINQLLADEPALLDGIDGLAPWYGDLIAIRNGANPHAILRLRLSDDGTRIVSVDTLERDNPEWGEPTLGVACREDDMFLYNSDAQWERYPDGYVEQPETSARPTRIRRLAVGE